jgi:antitoxin component of MazEF toxin-antitoxin module
MEKENPSVEVTAKIVKQGNSLCIRLPKELTRHMELYEGDLVHTTLKKVEMTQMPSWMVKLYRKHFSDEIKDMSDRDLNLCIVILGVMNKLAIEFKGKKQKEALDIYLKTAEIQYGKDFMKKWSKFYGLLSKKEFLKRWEKEVVPEMLKVPVWGEYAKEAMAKHEEWLKKNKKT